jgi:hypothetical protein
MRSSLQIVLLIYINQKISTRNVQTLILKKYISRKPIQNQV